MIGRWIAWLLLLTALVVIQPTGPVRGSAHVVPDQQLLVMLRMPPPHRRAGSDYGGAYGDAMTRAALRRVARRIARDHGLTLVDDWPMPLLGVDCVVMTVPDGREPTALIALIERERSVAWVQPKQIFTAQGRAARLPVGDPLLPIQPALHRWSLLALHRYASGRGVTVAVIDSRVDSLQPDLAGQLAAMQDFTGTPSSRPEAHGTEVAGVIAARANNGIGIAGIAPSSRLLALRACIEKSATQTVCDSLSLAKALHYAIDRGARIINLSLSGPEDILLARLIVVALKNRQMVVAAADPDRRHGGFPATLPGVIAVAAEGMTAVPTGAYTAPGRDVPATEPGNTWDLVNGSSFAAAHVSGLLALMREHGLSQLYPMRGGAVDACASLLRGRLRDCKEASAATR